MKRPTSILEAAVSILILSAIFIKLSLVLNLPYVGKIGLALCIFCIFSLLIVIFINKLFYRKRLPLDCLYSPFGVIEIHIGRKCKKDRIVFFELCLNAIKIGMKENRDILIDTWLIRKKNIKEYFGDSVKIIKPSFVQTVVNSIVKLMYCSFSKVKPYRCIIRTDKITNEQIKILEDKINKINNRNKIIAEINN